MNVAVERHRTAIRRAEPSRPIRLALNDSIITEISTVFDYGCGHGDDLRRLRRSGIACNGWDPAHAPSDERRPADIVNLGYVINVIEHATERVNVLREAWTLARAVLIVSARLTMEQNDERQRPWQDGWITRLGTFQKYYEQRELQEWIDAVLSVQSVAAGPGVFYVFRDEQRRNGFLAARYQRHRVAPGHSHPDALFQAHESLLTPLIEFVAIRGRLPQKEELALSQDIISAIGSLKRAWRIITAVTGADHWTALREERAQDLLVWLALARFPARPRFSALPKSLQHDVQTFFATYQRACEQADGLLYSAGDGCTINKACRASTVGKLTGSSLYVHRTALVALAPVLRVYEGCAHALIGSVEGANLIKFHHDEPKISYLSYPDFERDPHPSLVGSLSVDLQTFRTKYRDYTSASNPPILHRKELFLTEDHPLREKFARLTKQEERWNLYDDPAAIGTLAGWHVVLSQHGVRTAGHRVTRISR